MKALRYLICLVVGAASLATASNAQTVTLEYVGIGSSAMFLELGKAAVAEATADPNGVNVCSWSTTDAAIGGGLIATRIYSNDEPAAAHNAGNFWAVWAASTGTCAAPTGNVDIWSNLQVDSAVGNSCIFRTGSSLQECLLMVPLSTITNAVTGVGGANLITGQTDITTKLPTTISNALTGQQFGVAASDVRPEDSQFQVYRALQTTTTQLAATGAGGAQYQGLGLSSGGSTCTTIAVIGGSLDGAGASAGSVEAASFALPGGTDPCTSTAAVTSFTTIKVGVTPVVVVVNNGSGSVFSGTTFTNIPSSVLAGFLDGELCRAEDLLLQRGSTSTNYVTTLIPEPFSGPYTTVEYNSLATRAIQGSQETGISAPQTQPTVWTTCSSSSKGKRTRVTSTGNMVYAIQHNISTLGYFFWSVANARAFTSISGVPTNGRYLTVDGVDPLLNSYSNGCVPIATGTGACALASVDFANVRNGGYPLWSMQRLITTSNTTSTQQTEAVNMATAAQNAISTTLPDFIKPSSFFLVRSHFQEAIPSSASLGTAVAASNGDCTSSTEAGGDVGGAIYTNQADKDYCTDFGGTAGIVNLVNGGTTNGNPGQRK